MKRIFTLSVMLCAACVAAAVDKFLYSGDGGATIGSSPRELPTQGVSLSTGKVIVGLYSLDDAGRADCGWYRIVTTEHPAAQSNEYYVVSGYTFTNYTAQTVWTCKWKKVAPVKYSKLAIITALKTLNGANGDANAWVSVRKAIEAADLMDEWNACTYLATDNALFIALKAQAVAITGMSEEQVEAVLKECIY
jgi:hypothetical protein